VLVGVTVNVGVTVGVLVLVGSAVFVIVAVFAGTIISVGDALLSAHEARINNAVIKTADMNIVIKNLFFTGTPPRYFSSKPVLLPEFK